MKEDSNMVEKHFPQVCWMISLLLLCGNSLWAKWPVAGSAAEYFFYALYNYSNGIDTVSCFEPYSLSLLKEQGYVDEALIKYMMVNGDVFLVNDSVMQEKHKNRIIPSAFVDSIIIHQGLTALLFTNHTGNILVDSPKMTWEEEVYYMSLLFRQGYYFYRDDESGFFVLIK